MTSGHEHGPRTRSSRVLVLSARLAALASRPASSAGRALEWCHAASPDEVLERLQREEVQALVLGVEQAEPRFVEAVHKLRPGALLVFLSESEVDPALVRLAGRLEAFVCLSSRASDEALASQLEAILFPRAELRYRVRGKLLVELPPHFSGPRGLCPLWDISNHGLSWVMEAGAPGGPLFPETRIAGLCIRRGEDLILEAPLVVVRNLVTLSEPGRPGPPARYRVGASFVPQPIPPRTGKRVREPARILSLLQRAIRTEGIALCPPDEPEHLHWSQGGTLDLARPEVFALTGAFPAAWNQGTPLRATFEAAGQGHSFVTSVLEREPAAEGCLLRLRVPQVIRSERGRDARRCLLPDPSPVTVRLRSPFLDHVMQYPVLNVSTQGLLFRLEGHDTTLPPGTRLREVSLRGLAAEALAASARVLFVRRESRGGSAELHCGLSLAWASEKDRTLALDALISLQSPRVTSGQGLSFDDLWSFFKRAGFVYPEKEQSLAALLPQVRENLSRLLASPVPSILKTITYQDEGQVFGHQSLLRIYEHTWLVQHLSADPRGRRSLFAARGANIGVTDHMSQSPHVRWIRTYFQPQKTFPDRVVGGFARKVAGHPSSDLRLFSYLVSPVAPGVEEKPAPRGLEIRPWAPEDYKHIEAYFVEQGRLVELQASDLARDKLELKQIAAIYRELGLERWREVWVAEQRGQVLGVGLFEFSSVGLNLSDITNHSQVCSWGDAAAAQALARQARSRCRALGRSSCIILCAPGEARLFEPLGFKEKRQYSCWTFHRSLLAEYREHALLMLSPDHGRRGTR